jgi:hypothetical protein
MGEMEIMLNFHKLVIGLRIEEFLDGFIGAKPVHDSSELLTELLVSP